MHDSGYGYRGTLLQCWRDTKQIECASLQRRGLRKHVELAGGRAFGLHTVLCEGRQIRKKGSEAMYRQTLLGAFRLVLCLCARRA